MSAHDLALKIMRRPLPPGAGILFTRKSRITLGFALLGSLFLAALELAGIMLIVLLMQQLTGVGPSGPVSLIKEWTGASSPQILVVYLALICFAIYAVKALFALRFRHWMLHEVAAMESDTARRLLTGYLLGPYWKVLRRQTSDQLRTLNDATGATYGSVITAALSLLVEGMTILALLGYLLITMPIVTLCIGIVFAGTAALLMRYIKPRAIEAGLAGNEADARAYALTVTALSSVKEIKVRRRQKYFVDEYTQARLRSTSARARAVYFGEAPKYILEFIFIADVLILLGVISLTSAPGQSLALVAVFVAAGFRLLPSVTRCLGSAASIRAGWPMVALVVAALHDEMGTVAAWAKRDSAEAVPPTPLREALTLDQVSYAYPKSQVNVIDDLSLSIAAGESVGFVGSSGAGKSTLLDLITGLHEPTQGQVLIDGSPISECLDGWQQSIGLVPQEVFLFNASLRSNIAFVLNDAEIDDARVRDCLEQAQLWEWAQELPEGLDTVVGERGARVSGGQRQRLGIARALYLNPSVLILDEATSALDNATERKVSEAIESLHGKLTIITVAHRLSTVRRCDRIFFMEQGRVAASGTFEELMASSSEFARLVDLGRL